MQTPTYPTSNPIKPAKKHTAFENLHVSIQYYIGKKFIATCHNTNTQPPSKTTCQQTQTSATHPQPATHTPYATMSLSIFKNTGLTRSHICRHNQIPPTTTITSKQPQKHSKNTGKSAKITQKHLNLQPVPICKNTGLARNHMCRHNQIPPATSHQNNPKTLKDAGKSAKITQKHLNSPKPKIGECHATHLTQSTKGNTQVPAHTVNLRVAAHKRQTTNKAQMLPTATQNLKSPPQQVHKVHKISTNTSQTDQHACAPIRCPANTNHRHAKPARTSHTNHPNHLNAVNIKVMQNTATTNPHSTIPCQHPTSHVKGLAHPLNQPSKSGIPNPNHHK
eukprot:gene13153-8999_t